MQDFGVKADNGTNYGHVSMVLSETNSGRDLIVSDSNYSNDGKVKTRTIKDYKNNATIKGYTMNPASKISSGDKANDSILSKLAVQFYDQDKFEKSDLTGLGITEKQFKSMALPMYTQYKQQQYSSSGVDIVNPDVLANGSKVKKETFDKSLSEISAFEKNL